jgi:hypothetical protein
LPWALEGRIPEGYLESLTTGTNRVKHPALNAYYEKLRLVTRGPLFSPRRWLAILALNVGAYDHLLRDYLADYNMKRVEAAALPPAHPAPADDPSDVDEHYDWSTPSARTGVRFSEWGVRVSLAAPVDLEKIDIAGSADDYRVTFVRRDVAGPSITVRIPAEGKATVAVPTEAAGQTFDAVEIVPVGGAGLRRITHFATFARPATVGSARAGDLH